MQVRSRFVSHTGVLPLQVWDGECYQHHLQGLVPPIDLRKWSHQARAGDGLRRALGEVARLADAHLKQMSDMPWDSQWAPEQLEDAPVHVPLGEW